MATSEKPAHGFRRIAVLTLLNLAALLVLGQVEWNILNTGTYGFTMGVTGGVHAVEPGGPAARAGIAVGDKIDLSRMTPEGRVAELYPTAGVPITLEVSRRGVARAIVLTAAPSPPTAWWNRRYLYGYPLLVFISLCLATAVVLLRPGGPAWTYYAFVWFSTICAFQDYFYLLGWLPAHLAVVQIYQVAFGGALFSLALFSTRMYAPKRAWQLRWEAVILGFVLIDFLVWEYFLFGYVLGWPTYGKLIPIAGELADLAAAGSVLAVLSTIVRRTTEENRQRAAWVFVGLSLQPILIVLNATQELALSIFSGWISLTYTPVYRVLIPWAVVAGAVAVSYAFINERIIDIRFAIGRATGYAITSVLLVLFMAIAEWAVGELFADSNVAAYATLAAAILAAFSFNGLHKRIEALLDLAFFRREFLAEKRLHRAARALSFVTSERTVVEFLLDEPLAALELTSAALFQLDEDSAAYVCTSARAWPNGKPISVPVDDKLVAELRSEREPLALDAIGWSLAEAPTGPCAPLIAVPALARSDLYAFVLYGGHREGAVLNPDERALLGSLVTSAAATFDHIDAQRARHEIAELKRRLAEGRT